MRRRPKLHGDFCSRFLKCVVGTHKWKMNHLKVPVQDFVTVSDEAFALLVIVNNHERWMEKWKHKGEDETTVEAVRLVQPEFTNGGENLKNGRTRKHCGWSAEEIQLFNDLCAEVRASRAAWKEFDEKLLHKWQQERKSEQERRRQQKENQESAPVIVPVTDFPWDPNNKTEEWNALSKQTILEDSSWESNDKENNARESDNLRLERNLDEEDLSKLKKDDEDTEEDDEDDKHWKRRNQRRDALIPPSQRRKIGRGKGCMQKDDSGIENGKKRARKASTLTGEQHRAIEQHNMRRQLMESQNAVEKLRKRQKTVQATNVTHV